MNKTDWMVIAIFQTFMTLALVTAVWLYYWQVKRLQHSLTECAQQVVKLMAEKRAHVRIIDALKRGRPGS